MNRIEKNLCIKCNTVLINSALMCRSRRSEALMYLQEKTDQKSQILKIRNYFNNSDFMQKSDNLCTNLLQQTEAKSSYSKPCHIT